MIRPIIPSRKKHRRSFPLLLRKGVTLSMAVVAFVYIIKSTNYSTPPSPHYHHKKDEIINSNIISILEKLIQAKEKTLVAYANFHKILHNEYGEYKDKIFNKGTIMKSFHGPTELSTQRLQRRLSIKIIESILKNKEESNFNWVVAGHSSAAGHGNLFSQSYGYILEQSAKPIFETLGIRFYAKNYAMGATKSAPESALCMSAIYGLDLDILSWDFALTDGRRGKDLYQIWTQRVGVHESHPILVSYSPRFGNEIHPKLEEAGMSVFDAVFVQNGQSEFIPSMIPNSDDEDVNLDDLPKGIKFYRCNGRTESGELCGDGKNKWNTSTTCPENMLFQTKWHFGWKDHLLKGRVTGAFIIEQVLETLAMLIEGTEETLSNEENRSPTLPALSHAYLNHLYEMEAHDRKQFLTSEIPKIDQFSGELHPYHDAFMRSKSICHYAYLPSFSRFQGLVTERRQTLSYEGGGKTSYIDEGIDFYDEFNSNSTTTSPRLVYNYNYNRKSCSAAEIDFKDYFNIRNEDGWVKTVVPNDAENMAFSVNDDWKKRLGLISLCEMFFKDKKPMNFVSIPNLILFSSSIGRNGTTAATTTTTRSKIFVNDVPVTNYTTVGTPNSLCYVLRNENGFLFPSSDDMHGLGRYEVKFNVPFEGWQLYISSFIVI